MEKGHLPETAGVCLSASTTSIPASVPASFLTPPCTIPPACTPASICGCAAPPTGLATAWLPRVVIPSWWASTAGDGGTEGLQPAPEEACLPTPHQSPHIPTHPTPPLTSQPQPALWLLPCLKHHLQPSHASPHLPAAASAPAPAMPQTPPLTIRSASRSAPRPRPRRPHAMSPEAARTEKRSHGCRERGRRGEHDRGAWVAVEEINLTPHASSIPGRDPTLLIPPHLNLPAPEYCHLCAQIPPPPT